MPPEMPFTPPEKPKKPLYTLTVNIDMDSFYETIKDGLTRQADRPKEDNPQLTDNSLQEIETTRRNNNEWQLDPVVKRGTADITTAYMLDEGETATVFFSLELSHNSIDTLADRTDQYFETIKNVLKDKFDIKINETEQDDYENHVTIYFKSETDPDGPKIICILPLFQNGNVNQFDTDNTSETINPIISLDISWNSTRLQQKQNVKRDLEDAFTILDTIYTQIYSICRYNPPVRKIEPRYL